MLRASLAGMIALILVSCVTQRATYEPPEPVDRDDRHRRVVNRPYDDVWDALIQHAAATYFLIDNFEKDSGLITLTFGSENPSDFVDGGLWTLKAFKHGHSFEFDGKYVDYLATYQELTLIGRMNIVVRAISTDQCEVAVNARYIVNSIARDATGLKVAENNWSFTSGGEDTIMVRNPGKGTKSAARTLRPTYLAEETILDALEAL